MLYRIHNLTDKQCMASEIHAVHYLTAEYCTTIPVHIRYTVDILGKRKSVKLINISSGLHSEVLECLKGHLLVKNAYCKYTTLFY